jgi:hypothetical protein
MTDLELSTTNSKTIVNSKIVAVDEIIVKQPDWNTISDDAFLISAKLVFTKNTELLQRLA